MADKVTALQLWNAKLSDILRDNLFLTNRKGSVIPIKIIIDRTQKAIQEAERFEVTKHRVIIDAMIEALNKENVKVSRWNAVNRIRTKATIEAYKKALMILVNTAPPNPTEETAEERMEKYQKEGLTIGSNLN